MRLTIEVDNLQDGYLEVVRSVLENGSKISPRGLPTTEILGATILIHNPAAAIPVGVGRKLNLAIGAAESCQLVGGVSDALQMVGISNNFMPFVHDDRFRGAYGPRTFHQFPRMVKLLKEDPDTRQAGVVIWREWDLANKSTDVPCTVELHFVIRDGKLNMHAIMRSNDVFWGLTYDAWMFSNVLHAVAYAINIPVGKYYHTAVSLHIYDRDLKAIENLYKYDGNSIPPMLTNGMYEGKDDELTRWIRISSLARNALGRIEEGTEIYFPGGFSWYREKLKGHESTGLLCPSCRYILPALRSHFSSISPRSSVRKFLMCRWCSVAHRHDISYEAFEALWIAQEGKCAICKKPRSLVIDHNHKTNRVRGLLCRPCNVAIGLLDETVKPMDDYLTKPTFELAVVPKDDRIKLRAR